jgi:hypothetical protein
VRIMPHYRVHQMQLTVGRLERRSSCPPSTNPARFRSVTAQ